MTKILSLFLSFFMISALLQAQNSLETIVEINLKKLEYKQLGVKVSLPEKKKEIAFIIPNSLPGTYIEVDYSRYFKNLKAYDIHGNEAKVKKKKNVFYLKGKADIDYLEYVVKDVESKRGLIDRPTNPTATIFTPESALINFNMLNGYFEGYSENSFKVIVHKSETFYGATMLKKVTSSSNMDVLFAENYHNLIDRPVLYAKADTSSFMVGNQKIMIAGHSETSNTIAENFKNNLAEEVLNGVNKYLPNHSTEDYLIIVYTSDKERLKGIWSKVNLNALNTIDHENSSIYYGVDFIDTLSTSKFNFAKNYYKTLTTHSIHDEKFENHNFKEVDYSKHYWMYEGFARYFALQTNTYYDESDEFRNRLEKSINKSYANTEVPLTELSYKDAKMESFIQFFYVLRNEGVFDESIYIAFCLDLDILSKTKGKKRLIDVLMEIQKEYKGKAFGEGELVSVFQKYGYDEFDTFYKKYIEGTDTPEVEKYLDLLGWEYYSPDYKEPSFGEVKAKIQEGQMVVFEHYRNTLALRKGDIILSINDQNPAIFFNDNQIFEFKKPYPEITDEVKVVFKRDNEERTVIAHPEWKEKRGIKVKDKITSDQEKMRSYLFPNLKKGIEI